MNPLALVDFTVFLEENGMRLSDLAKVLTEQVDPEAPYAPMSCITLSTPPQEGKTTWVAHYLAWQLIRNPRLNIIYVSYSQFRANSVSRQIRSIVNRWTPLRGGTKNVSQWQTSQGGGLLAAGRGTGVTGFSCDLLVIDDPIKDMQEAQSKVIRETITDHFSSVLLTRMASTSQIIVITTRWHKEDLTAHVTKTLNAKHVNITAQAVDEETDPLGRKVGQWLNSVQNRSSEAWEKTKNAVGSYVWSALYQGDPQVTGGSYINVDNIDIVPFEGLVTSTDTGVMYTLVNAHVIQSWDLAFTGKGDYVAGQVWANIGGTWFLLDKVHQRATFTQTVNLVQRMAAKWPQTARIYVEQAANGAALIDTLKKRAALIKPVTPKGSKESRALAIQPLVDSGRVKVLEPAYDERLFEEWRDFPFFKNDDQVDAMTQALLTAKTDFVRMVN